MRDWNFGKLSEVLAVEGENVAQATNTESAVNNPEITAARAIIVASAGSLAITSRYVRTSSGATSGSKNTRLDASNRTLVRPVAKGRRRSVVVPARQRRCVINRRRR